METNEIQIIKSWEKNAEVWTAAIQNEEIESRKLITNKAIVEAITDYHPSTALDVGCGEGWLARILIEQNIKVTGVDVIPELIDIAKKTGSGEYRVLSYDDIADGKMNKKFDAVVCNFSLIGKESVAALLKAIPGLLNKEGHLFIQTLHPVTACGEQPYQEGWREGSWSGFNSAFTDPAPWYFRTLEAWIKMFRDSDLKLVELREPLHPKTSKPASVIFICRQIA